MKSRISGKLIRDKYKTYLKDGRKYTHMDDFVQLNFMRTARITDEEFDQLFELIEESDFEWFTKDELNYGEKKKLVGLMDKLK